MNQREHPPDVTALIVTRETDVTRALRGSREKNVTPVLLVTMETYVVSFSNVIGETNFVNSPNEM